MHLTSINEQRAYVARIPQREAEVHMVVVPQTYLGSDRWHVRHAETGQMLYVAGHNILRPAASHELNTGETSFGDW